jgi:thioredoxin-related protein
MRPIVHGLEAEYGNCIDFVYLDIDDSANQDAMRQYKFQAQPLLILLDGNGKELWRKFGRISREQLEAELKSAMP